MEISTFHENVLLYLYSTAPQVLGAILALLGVFHIMWLQKYKKEILSISQWLITHYKSPKSGGLYIRIKHQHSGYEKLKDSIGKIKSSHCSESIPGLHIGFKQIKRSLKELVNKQAEEIQEQSKKQPILESEILSLNEQSKRGENLTALLRNTMKLTTLLFWYNGTVIFFYLASFIALPYYIKVPHCYWISLLIGILIAGVSLYTMIGYIYNCVLERQQLSLFNPFKHSIYTQIQEKLAKI